MNLSSGGILLLEQLEGKRNSMYIDSAGHPTIGIGHLILPTEGWMNTATLTDDQVYTLLRSDIRRFEIAVANAIKVPLEQEQFDALVILAFNIGTGAFATSTVVQRINAKDTQARIVEAWGWWNKANGQVLQGLVNRRNAEIELFVNGAKKKGPAKSSSTASSASRSSSSSAIR